MKRFSGAAPISAPFYLARYPLLRQKESFIWRNKKARRTGLWKIGGEEGDRTLDLRIANATLSQLSYFPNGDDSSKVRVPELARTGLNRDLLRHRVAHGG